MIRHFNNNQNELLGVTIDEKFEEQTSKVCKKVNKKVGVLKRMKTMLPFDPTPIDPSLNTNSNLARNGEK